MCEYCDWEDQLEAAKELLTEVDGEIYGTVEGIVEWIEQNQHVTPKQVTALENIAGFQENKWQYDND